MVTGMRPGRPGSALAIAALLAVVLSLGGGPAAAWGNGDPGSVEFPNFGIHDITCDIALRSASITSEETLTWLNDWYERNTTDGGYSFDPASTRPTATDNVNAYTDDPDSFWKDWDNHTLYLHPRAGRDPVDWDAARRVAQLYNLTRDRLYWWLMNGSVRYDLDQHYAAYYGGLMAHYVTDVTQFGHTDWTSLDHSHPLDDPANATYHSYYEARAWTDRALRACHVDLMMRDLPEFHRVSDPAQAVRDLATFVNGRHGPDVQFQDTDGETVVLGSTYVKMLDLFVTNWDARTTHNGARGFDEELWDLTLENLFAGMDNLTNLWSSAYLDARDMFRAEAADLAVGTISVEPPTGAWEGLVVNVTAPVLNQGRTHTGYFTVALYIDNDSAAELLVSVGAGNGTAARFAWTAVAGTHELRVVADVYQQVPEGNETNNVAWRMYSVDEAHHASRLTAQRSTIYLLQDDTGQFNLTLTNLGNKPDAYRLSLQTFPGAIDFSLTLHLDEVTLGAGGSVGFHIDVGTLLDNPVGPRYFTLVAEGGNSTSSIILALVVGQRNTAPNIEVEYGFYGNVSIPTTFDASATWDREGDAIWFNWTIDGVDAGTGPVLEWTFDEEGDYLILLTASDGTLERQETLEVSILDAIPPTPKLELLDVDRDAARIEWGGSNWPGYLSSWNSARFFWEYRVYASENVSDPERVVGEGDPVATVSLVYVNNATVIMPDHFWYADKVTVVVAVVNIYGLHVLSNAVTYEPEIRHRYHIGDWSDLDDPIRDALLSPLYFDWVHVLNVTKYSFEVEWREWLPIGEGGYYLLHLYEVWLDHPTRFNITQETVTDLSDASRSFADLSPGMNLELSIRYYSSDGERYWEQARSLRLVENVPPRVRTAPYLDAVAGEGFTHWIIAEDPDGALVHMTIDWGDGGLPMERDGGNASIDHTYKGRGTYTITVEVWDDDDDVTRATTQVRVEEGVDDGPGGEPWDSLTAIAIIVLVALLGVIAGHLTGYYRIGREREGKEEEEAAPADEEPRTAETPTAEQIVSELEEELGIGEGADDVGVDDDEYFDHEPSVAELEAMIPRDPEG